VNAIRGAVESTSVDVLGVLAKFWQPGRVKTRLARSIGPEAAARMYHVALTTTLARLSQLAGRRTLVFTPEQHRNDFAALGPVATGAWSLRPQVTGDLGERMAGFFAEAFGQGADHVVLLGSDSPTVPLTYIRRAFELLRDHDVVLGPSRDGGYYLVGQSSPQGDMFAHIDWSTAQVWPQTLARLDSLDVSLAALPEWYDIDTIDDLRQLASEIDHAARPDAALDVLRDAVRTAITAGEECR
jgi:rSAM/selenodomain-associated transferase 1